MVLLLLLLELDYVSRFSYLSGALKRDGAALSRRWTETEDGSEQVSFPFLCVCIISTSITFTAKRGGEIFASG